MLQDKMAVRENTMFESRDSLVTDDIFIENFNEEGVSYNKIKHGRKVNAGQGEDTDGLNQLPNQSNNNYVQHSSQYWKSKTRKMFLWWTKSRK